MNREPNKEIDILLRKLSGKQNGNIAGAEGNSSASAHEHLDADELNAYAENALPAPLRSRYTEHVADCSSCRKIVTQLALSSTAATAQAGVEKPAPSRLKSLLAGLFSPLVIRYAVPAMAVILLVAIAWIVVRREPFYEQVTQNTSSRPTVSEPVNSPAAAPLANNSATTRNAETTAPPAEKPAAPSEDRAATSAGNKAPEETKAEERPAKQDEPPPSKRPEPTPAPVTAAAPTGGAAIAQPKAVSEAERNESEKKKAQVEVANVQNQNQNIQNQNIQNQQERRIYDQRSGPSEPKAVQRGQRSNENVGAINRQRAKIAEEQDKEGRDKDAARDDVAEVRNVGGHRFTKRGNVWVDALYKSNTATTNVSRGSEQYRSLLGDEPDLRAIVEQISGEMIVVWKGRAYRIK